MKIGFVDQYMLKRVLSHDLLQYDDYHEEIELMDDSRLFGPEDPKKVSLLIVFELIEISYYQLGVEIV